MVLWDKWILFSLFVLFTIGESIVISVNVVPSLWESYLNMGIYRKPLLQLLVFILGLLLSGVIARVDYRSYMRGHLPYVFILLSVLSLLLVLVKKLVLGKPVDRWLLGTSLQPLEFVKLALVIFLTSYILNKGGLQQWKYFLWAIFFPVLIALLLLFQPDKGGAVFVLLLTAAIIYVGGVPKRVYIILFLLMGLFIHQILSSGGYVAERLSAWKDPFADPEEGGYQIIQSIYALARGGPLGVGLGQGIQKMGPLPTADSDYIMATVGEELGFMGILTVFILYGILISRLFYHSLKTQDRMGKLILFGTAINFALAFLWNTAMVSNLIPPKGIALPFLSYGPSNLLASMLFIGVAHSVINNQGKSSRSLPKTSSALTALRHT